MVVVCSKPLQFFNAVSVIRHHRVDHALVYLTTGSIDGAAGFRRFVEGSGVADVIDEVRWVPDDEAAIADFRDRDYDTLVIDDDRLLMYRRFSPLRTSRLAVLEEGIGTYRTSSTRSPTGLRWLKWRTLAAVQGLGWAFGSGRLTDTVFVGRPDVFARLNPRLEHKVCPFPGLMDELSRHHDHLRAEVVASFDSDVAHDLPTALILSTWGGSDPAVWELAGRSAEVVVHKPHPHDGVGAAADGVVEIVDSWIPAEAVVAVLADLASRLTVYHHSSSASFYAGPVLPDVEFVDVLGLDQLREVLEAAQH